MIGDARAQVNQHAFAAHAAKERLWRAPIRVPGAAPCHPRPPRGGERSRHWRGRYAGRPGRAVIRELEGNHGLGAGGMGAPDAMRIAVPGTGRRVDSPDLPR